MRTGLSDDGCGNELKQGCVLSPLLFAWYLAEREGVQDQDQDQDRDGEQDEDREQGCETKAENENKTGRPRPRLGPR